MSIQLAFDIVLSILIRFPLDINKCWIEVLLKTAHLFLLSGRVLLVLKKDPQSGSDRASKRGWHAMIARGWMLICGLSPTCGARRVRRHHQRVCFRRPFRIQIRRTNVFCLRHEGTLYACNKKLRSLNPYKRYIAAAKVGTRCLIFSGDL